jgi:hypothetical protein
MKLSFLTCSMNRLHHLKETYLHNISKSKSSCDVNIEFVLLNYNSTDGISDWMNECRSILDSVEFNYVHSKTAKYFDMSKVKNILGKSATGTHLCWLDADNYTEDGFVDFVHNNFKMHPNSILNVPYSDNTVGFGGRVVCSKTHFLEVGGYDESFVGWGYEEIDFVNRLHKSGCKKISIPIKYLRKIEHTDQERVSNYNPKFTKQINPTHKNSNMKYKSNLSNFMKSSLNIKNNKLIANSKLNWGTI